MATRYTRKGLGMAHARPDDIGPTTREFLEPTTEPHVEAEQLPCDIPTMAEAARRFGTPIYLYDEDTVRNRYHELARHIAYPDVSIHYACKANSNAALLGILREAGAGLETVSAGEIQKGLDAGFTPEQMIYTCAGATREELQFVVEQGVPINADSLGQLDTIGGFSNSPEGVGLRVNQGIGGGHHDHVITGGPESKFGINLTDIEAARRIASRHNLRIVGLQQHIGSNIVDEPLFLKAMDALLKSAEDFRNLKYLDFGGGFGVPDKPGDRRLDLSHLGPAIVDRLEHFTDHTRNRPEIIFEPGRYLVAEAGALLTRVTDIKESAERRLVLVDTGFNHLARPMVYDAYHHIINLSHPELPTEMVRVAGNVCESGDIFAKYRMLPECHVGDTLAILKAGAYGRAMASEYNSRPLPKEVLCDRAGALRVIS